MTQLATSGDAQIATCVLGRRCWLCGGPLGRFMAFVIEPVGAVTRIAEDPPSHRRCAFAHVGDHRGVAAVWATTSYRLMGNLRQGVLFDIGLPDRVTWFCEGRPAKRTEVDTAFALSLPVLREQCDLEESEGRRHAAHRALDRELMRLSVLLESVR
jgi:hypothetical protein